MASTAGFEIIRELGRGGMASVYLAKQVSLNREVALKIMSPALSVDADFKQRFLKEGQLIAQLNHPHVVTVYDIGFASKRYYIAMEYLGSGSLKDEIRKGMEVRLAIRVTKQVAQALGYAHKKNIIHRDVKPLNIMFREPGESVLTDFGIAKVTAGDTQLTRTGMLVGTPSYMSPEQAKGEGLDGRSDLYSLGIVLYEMLTGERPYDTEDSFSTALKHLTAPIPRLPDPMQFMQPVIDRLLAKTRDERYTDAAGLVEHLEQIEREMTLGTEVFAQPAGQQTVAATPHSGATSGARSWFGSAPRTGAQAAPGTVATAPPAGSRRMPLMLTLLLALVLAGAGGAYYFLWRSPALDAKTERIVQLLLDKAKGQMAREQYFAPQDGNAVQTYREILQMAPDYKPALQGLTRVADLLEQRARKQHGQGDMDACLATIEQGLSAVPTHPGLQGLKDLVQKERQLDELFALAEQQMAAGNYSAPAGNNAVETFRQALQLSPGHPRAQQGLTRVLDWFLSQSRRQLEAREYQGVKTLVAEGLKIDPSAPVNAELKKLGEQASAAIEQQGRQQRIDDLLASAKRQLAAGQDTSPVGDNALESFRAVLRLDPNLDAARQGESDIRERLLKGILDAIQTGELGQAAEKLQLGKQAFPDNVKLIAAAQVLEQRREARDKAQRIADLLDLAQQRAKAGALSVPEGSSALHAYREILLLDPGNAAARDGIDKMVRHYRDAATAARKGGQLPAAMEAVDNGLKVEPGNPELQGLKQALQQDLQRQRESEQLKLQIAETLTRAREQFAQGRLSVPPGDNALQSFRQVLGIDPQNRDAAKGVSDIAQRYRERVREQFEQNRLDQGLALAAEALDAFADDAELTDLKARLEIRAEDAALQRRIDDAVSTADALMESPDIDKARAQTANGHLQQALKLDPKSRRALDAVGRLKEKLRERAQVVLGAGDLSQAEALAQFGLELKPGSAGVDQSLESVLGEISERRRSLAREARIGELLAAGRGHLAADRLSTPGGGNAVESFRQALELDRANSVAQQGLEQVASRYREKVAEQLGQGRIDGALDLAAEGLGAFPDDTELSTLKAKALAEKAAAADRDKITDLLRAARRQTDDNRLLLPAGDNAHETYQQVLALDPGNAEALQGIQSIAAGYYDLAREKQANGELQQAATMVQRGLSVEAKNPRLLSLDAEIRAAIDEQDRQREMAARERQAEEARRQAEAAERRRQEEAARQAEAEKRRQQQSAQIQSLLAEADGHYRYGRLSKARDVFEQVLKLDGRNREARAGLGQVADAYYDKARRSYQSGRLDDAWDLTQEGLRAQAGHKRLTSMSRDIQSARRDQAAATEKRRKAEEQKRLAEAAAKQREAELARKEAEEEQRRKEEEEKKAWKPRVFGTF